MESWRTLLIARVCVFRDCALVMKGIIGSLLLDVHVYICAFVIRALYMYSIYLYGSGCICVYRNVLLGRRVFPNSVCIKLYSARERERCRWKLGQFSTVIHI